jgi:hypothetical protein
MRNRRRDIDPRLLQGLRVSMQDDCWRASTSPCTRPTGEEIRALMTRGQEGVPPQHFVDGLYLDGVEEVVALHGRSRL